MSAFERLTPVHRSGWVVMVNENLTDGQVIPLDANGDTIAEPPEDEPHKHVHLVHYLVMNRRTADKLREALEP